MNITSTQFSIVAGVATLANAMCSLSSPTLNAVTKIAAGSGFSADVLINEDGTIAGVNVIDGGSNYKQGFAWNLDGDGTGAVLLPMVEDGCVTSVTVVNPGQDYTGATLSVSSQTGVFLEWTANEDPRFFMEWDIYCAEIPGTAGIVNPPESLGRPNRNVTGSIFMTQPVPGYDFVTGQTYSFSVANYGPQFPMESGDAISNTISITW